MQETALYLEADEDITSAIDKLSKAQGGSVQIVVPKRSTLLQSIINLKLLKKAADSHHKELVLVTGDKIASELAARVGLAVAPSLGAKAVLKTADRPAELKTAEEVIEADDPEPPELDTEAAAPLAPTTPPAAKPKVRRPLLKRRELTDAPAAPPPPPEPKDLDPDSSAADTAKAAITARSPKVPNFNLLQSRLKWVGLAVLLIVAYFVLINIFTSAKITLYANGTQVSVDTSFAVDTQASASDPTNSVLAGRTITASKDLSGSFAPTGTQDVGTPATGTMTVYNSYDENPHTLVAGTRFQAPDGNIFLSTSDVTVPGATLSLNVGHVTLNPGQATVAVQAAANGGSYNEAPADYTIPGLPAGEQSQSAGIYAHGAQMSGGTSKTVSIVAQADVGTAQKAVLAKDAPNSAGELKANLPSGYTVVPGSQTTTASAVTPSPAVGSQADTATLQLQATYTELAVKTSDIQAFARAAEQKQVGAANQIYDDGLGSAQITSSGQDSSNRPTFHLAVTAYSGAKLDAASIATALKGKKYGDAANYASGLPGVSQATINIWPPWAGKLPSNASKIKVTIKVASQ